MAKAGSKQNGRAASLAAGRVKLNSVQGGDWTQPCTHAGLEIKAPSAERQKRWYSFLHLSVASTSIA
eukprot:scaffold151062_cov13-Tisochrysis_lutea.AAC.1